jgi:hypothetical protein
MRFEGIACEDLTWVIIGIAEWVKVVGDDSKCCKIGDNERFVYLTPFERMRSECEVCDKVHSEV